MICEETYATAWQKMAAEEGHAKRLPEQTGKTTNAPNVRAERIRDLLIAEGPMIMAVIAKRLNLSHSTTTDALQRGLVAGMFVKAGWAKGHHGGAQVWATKETANG